MAWLTPHSAAFSELANLSCSVQATFQTSYRSMPTYGLTASKGLPPRNPARHLVNSRFTTSSGNAFRIRARIQKFANPYHTKHAWMNESSGSFRPVQYDTTPPGGSLSTKRPANSRTYKN